MTVWSKSCIKIYCDFFLIFRSTNDERHEGVEGRAEVKAEAGVEAEVKW